MKKIAILLMLMVFGTMTAQQTKVYLKKDVEKLIAENIASGVIAKNPIVVLDGIHVLDFKNVSSEWRFNGTADVVPKNSTVFTTKFGDIAKNGVVMLHSVIVLNADAKKTLSQSKVLYLLDGKEVSSTELHGINPDNIASVKVIKDADKIAKYTTKQDYDGVVLITSNQ